MKIAIDSRAVNHNPTGIGYYIKNLVKWLYTIDSVNQYFCYLDPRYKSGLNSFPPRGVIRLDAEVGPPSSLTNRISRILWERFYLPIQLKKDTIDLYHGASGRLPLLKLNTSFVVTIYDLIPYRIPWNYPNVLRFKFTLLESIQRVNKIIAISEHAKMDLVNTFHIPGEKIHVVYGGLEDRFGIMDSDLCKKYLKNTYGISREFILFVGSLEPKKNISRLIEAFSHIQKQFGRKYFLVLIGSRDLRYEEILKNIRETEMEEEVVLTGYVKDEDLPYFYNAASLFVFPSLYEGFGLPLLEAMACGLPIVASNRSSIPEVVDNAGVLFDPYNVQEMADTMEKVLSDENLRDDLRQKGLNRVKLFTWEKAARETLTVYEKAYRMTHPNLKEA